MDQGFESGAIFSRWLSRLDPGWREHPTWLHPAAGVLVPLGGAASAGTDRPAVGVTCVPSPCSLQERPRTGLSARWLGSLGAPWGLAITKIGHDFCRRFPWRGRKGVASTSCQNRLCEVLFLFNAPDPTGRPLFLRHFHSQKQVNWPGGESRDVPSLESAGGAASLEWLCREQGWVVGTFW